MSKVIITNGWHDLNAGDSAIIMGMISVLKNKNLDIKSFVILSELCEENEFYKESIDCIKKYHFDKNIELIPSPFFKIYTPSILNRVKEIFSLIQALLGLMFPFLLPRRYLHEILDSNVMISKGGHFIHDRGGIKGLIHLFKCLFPLLVGIHFKKKIFILGQSIGPVKSDSILSYLSYRLISYVLKKATAISVRESVSLLHLKDNLINNNFLYLSTDYAFALCELGRTNKKDFTSNYIVLTLRQHLYEKNTESMYLATLDQICREINSNYGLQIYVVPHVRGPNSFENDDIISRKFMKKYGNNNIYKYKNDISNPIDLIKLYSGAKILIGTRFHSVIFALLNCTPVIAISYSGYKANIMNQFQLEDFMISIEDVSHENIDILRKMVNEIMNNYSLYLESNEKNLANVVSLLNNDQALKKLFSYL